MAFHQYEVWLCFPSSLQSQTLRQLDHKVHPYFFILSILRYGFPSWVTSCLLTNPHFSARGWHPRQLLLYSLSGWNSVSGYTYLACLYLTPASVKTYFSFSDTAEHWPRAPWRAGAVILFCDPPQILTHISTNETHYTNWVSVSHCHAY